MSNVVTPLLIYGAGGFARETAWLAETCQRHGSGLEPVGYIDDALQPGSESVPLNGLPAMTLDEAADRFPGAAFVAGIGSPKARQAVTEKALARGLREVSLIHPRAEMSRFVQVGDGTVICAGSILTTNIVLGRGTQINLDCTIGHDVNFGDYVTLAPGAHISGNVQLGNRVYVGTGAVIINGTPDQPLVIGYDTVIGANACVTRSIAAGVTAVGVPAKPLEKKVHAAV
jgi:sugar O-acyltransferase (sialic acid O-acetyltransferase NeuD family)